MKVLSTTYINSQRNKPLNITTLLKTLIQLTRLIVPSEGPCLGYTYCCLVVVVGLAKAEEEYLDN